MRSRAERVEGALRAAAVGALLLAWWGQGAPGNAPSTPPPSARWEAPTAPGVADSVRQWAQAVGAAEARGDRSPPVRDVWLGAIPDAAARALLAALPVAGVPLRWHDATGAAGGAVQRRAVPGPGTLAEVRGVAGPTGVLLLRDDGGLLDSVRLPPGAVQGWRLVAPEGTERVEWPAPAPRGAPTGASRPVPTDAAALAPGAPALAGAAPAPSPLRVRLLGAPGWEGKFMAAALEEAGWRVEGQWAVSPVAAVTLGSPGPLTPETVAAVVVLDSTVPIAEAPAVRRYLASGGGVVLAGDGGRWPGGAGVATARADARIPGAEGGVRSATPVDGLERWQLVPEPGAQVLARGRDGSAVTVVAPRGAGRVAVVAYRDSWRWRMAGLEDGAAGHRQWWDAVVRLVAVDRTRWQPASSPFPGPGAPWLDLVARLGAPAPAERAAPAVMTRPDPPPSRGLRARTLAARWGPGLFLAAALLLLAEWTARRTRGRP